jgi:hypothetical protein
MYGEAYKDMPKIKLAYVALTKGARAFHSGIGSGVSSFIHLAADTSASSVVHEYGHALEHQRLGIHKEALEFLHRRVGDEPAQPLQQVVPDSHYEPDERGRKNGFDKAFGDRSAWYVGKDYGKRATEVVSMGLEKLYEDPAGLAEKDPDYFRFIMRVLRRKEG